MNRESRAPREFAHELTERYDVGAAVYRELWAPVLLHAARPLVEALAGEGVERVVDVGTGVGTLLPDLTHTFAGARVFGVDRSRGMLRLAPAAAGRALMDARQLAIASARVDRVLCVFMLFHLDEPALALREAHRVLRGGGKIGTLTWGEELASPASRIWVECLDEHGALPPDPASAARHAAVDSPAKVVELLRGAGFEAPHAWDGELVYTLETDHLIRLKTSLGASKVRFESLAPAAATACEGEARRRMARLGPDDFVARSRIVYATASRRG